MRILLARHTLNSLSQRLVDWLRGEPLPRNY